MVECKVLRQLAYTSFDFLPTPPGWFSFMSIYNAHVHAHYNYFLFNLYIWSMLIHLHLLINAKSVFVWFTYKGHIISKFSHVYTNPDNIASSLCLMVDFLSCLFTMHMYITIISCLICFLLNWRCFCSDNNTLHSTI
jgi:hypothetical protein